MSNHQQHHADGAVYSFYLALTVWGFALGILIVGLVFS